MNRKQTPDLWTPPPMMQYDYPLSECTTLGVGGPAARFLDAANAEEIADALTQARLDRLPTAWIGNGSNLLVHDRGFPGLVVRIGPRMARWEITPENLIVEAGATLDDMVDLCCERSLLDLSFLVDIPGTVGGAVFMNAGTNDGCVSDKLEWVELLHPETGNLEKRPASDIGFFYHSSELEKTARVVARAAFRREKGDGAAWRKKADDTLALRIEKQPRDTLSAGSYFRNPPGEHAGYLIERAGLRGKQIGGARVSDKHGNFLINAGGATFADFVDLTRFVRDAVRERFGLALEMEVRLLGLTPEEERNMCP